MTVKSTYEIDFYCKCKLYNYLPDAKATNRDKQRNCRDLLAIMEFRKVLVNESTAMWLRNSRKC